MMEAFVAFITVGAAVYLVVNWILRSNRRWHEAASIRARAEAVRMIEEARLDMRERRLVDTMHGPSPDPSLRRKLDS